MEKNEIQEIISNYSKLKELTRSKIEVIQKYDSEFSTLRGIENIRYYDELVGVACDNTCRGCYDSHYFTFPVEWLTIQDSDLEKVVTDNKKLRMEAELNKKLERQKKIEEEKEKKEREEYEKLKKKFEN